MSEEDRTPEPEHIPSHRRTDIDTGTYNKEDYNPPDWITDLDREILALLGNTKLILTPALIAKNIDRPRSSVSRRLSTLEAGELVEKVERGHYQISDEGYGRMAERISTEHYEYGSDELDHSTILTPEEIEKMEKGESIR